MDKKTKNKLIWAAIGVVILALVGFLLYRSSQPGQYDTLAQCIEQSGAKFYGASWCPHCRSQKEQFGRSARLLPYVECSLPGSQAQNEVCNKAGVQAYPTWVFPDGTRQTGVMSFNDLAARTGCEAPVQ